MEYRLMLECLILFCAYSIAQHLNSPCPDYFVYQTRDDSTDRWYGLLNLESNEEVTGVVLKITLNNAALGLTNAFAPSFTTNNKEYVIVDRDYRMKPNSSYLIRFFVRYDIERSMPELVKILQNGRTICEETRRPSRIYDSVLIDPTNASILFPDNEVQNNDNEIECGTIAAQAVPLIVNGKVSDIGEYPWHAAIFRKDSNEKMYQCGASLISKQHIITIAACVSSSEYTYEVHLGQQNISDNESPRIQIHEISNSVIHPEYTKNFSKRRNNIAISKLTKPVKFNDFVRPICLWEGDTNYEKIVGKVGIFVGWGASETYSGPVENVQAVNVTAVSQQDCLKRNFMFYLSNDIYCAVAEHGYTCSGDGGGGMVFLRENTSKKVYQLRGILSYGRGCDQRNYDVYTDVATYLEFIQASLK